MSKHLSLEQMEAATERQGALESITIKDRDWLLASMLLDSLEDDLAAALYQGWWLVDPVEMLEQPPRHLRIRSGHARPVQAAQLARELDSQAIQRLYHIVRACTNGRVAAGRGSVIRNARRKAQCHGRYVRGQRRNANREGLAA